MNPVIPLLGAFSANQAEVWCQSLQAALPDETIVLFEALSDLQRQQATIAIVANPEPEQLAQLPNLAWVQSLWAGVERIIPLFEHRQTQLVRLIDPMLAETMAEAVLTWTLYLHRKMHRYQAQQRRQHWQPLDYQPAEATRVGILGLGELGQASAHRLQQNKFQVSGWSRTEKQLANIDCRHGEQGLQQLLQRSDILICLLPLTAQTRQLLNKETLAHCKAGACLVNFARGAIIDDQALLQQLDTDQLEHAVLDVFATEPLPSTHRYWQHPKVSVLPHISAPTSRASACQVVSRNIQRFRATGDLPSPVDLKRGY